MVGAFLASFCGWNDAGHRCTTAQTMFSKSRHLDTDPKVRHILPFASTGSGDAETLKKGEVCFLLIGEINPERQAQHQGKSNIKQSR